MTDRTVKRLSRLAPDTEDSWAWTSLSPASLSPALLHASFKHGPGPGPPEDSPGHLLLRRPHSCRL